MGAEVKEKLRQSLMKITPYQTYQTNKDENLTSSINAKKKTGLFTNEKNRSSVDNEHELKSAL